MGSDPFGRAIHDFQRGELAEPLVQRDGEAVREHPIEANYFGEYDPDSERGAFHASWLDGPLLDIGAGAGRDTLYFQEQFETVAIDVSEHLIETMRERGVADARYGDLFSLREAFEADRFQSALAYGTQVGLVGSMKGLRRFLGDLAFITRSTGTAVIDCYDPDQAETEELLGYRVDPTSGLAHRVTHFEYEGDVGETLLFRLFSPDRVREAAVGTGWTVTEIRHDRGERAFHYQAALTKS